MASFSTGCELDGVLSPQESVVGMIQVIESKDMRQTGTFWTWEGKVRPSQQALWPSLTTDRSIHGEYKRSTFCLWSMLTTMLGEIGHLVVSIRSWWG